MDFNLLSVIKKEKEAMLEESNDNYLPLSFDVCVKVENEPKLEVEDWCIQDALSPERSGALSPGTEQEECVMCGAAYFDRFSLYKHNLTHLKVPLVRLRIYMCDICPNFYSRRNDLEDHIATHKAKVMYNGKNSITSSLHRCEVCRKVFSYKSWFEHRRNVHGQSRVQCDRCEMVFKCERYLKRHVKYVHEGLKPLWRCRKSHPKTETNVQCPKCPSTFTHRGSLTTHLKNCHSEASYECKLCKSVLKSMPYYTTHMKRVHYDDGTVHTCARCGKGFRSPLYLRVHVKNSHRSLNTPDRDKS